MPLRLHAVIPNNGHPPLVDSTNGGRSLVPYRELAAVVTEVPDFRREALGSEQVNRHRVMVDLAFRRGPVLPAPLGVLFRHADVLVRWMELHYVVLQDALGFLEDRVGARVHAAPSLSHRPTDVAASATEAFHALREAAVTSVPLARLGPSGTVASAAFLLERAQWPDFETAVSEQENAHANVRLAVSGPWPPYDFVRMRFQTGEEE